MAAGKIAQGGEDQTRSGDNQAAQLYGHALFEQLKASLRFAPQQGQFIAHPHDAAFRRQLLPGGFGERFRRRLGLLAGKTAGFQLFNKLQRIERKADMGGDLLPVNIRGGGDKVILSATL